MMSFLHFLFFFLTRTASLFAYRLRKPEFEVPKALTSVCRFRVKVELFPSCLPPVHCGQQQHFHFICKMKKKSFPGFKPESLRCVSGLLHYFKFSPAARWVCTFSLAALNPPRCSHAGYIKKASHVICFSSMRGTARGTRDAFGGGGGGLEGVEKVINALNKVKTL